MPKSHLESAIRIGVIGTNVPPIESVVEALVGEDKNNERLAEIITKMTTTYLTFENASSSPPPKVI